MQVVDMPASETNITLRVTLDDFDPSGNRTAIVAHGAGSSGDFVRRAFGPPLRAAGWRLVSYDLRGHGGSTPVEEPERLGIDAHAADLLRLAERTGATLLGGVSMGAHAAVLGALDTAAPPGLEGLLLALPAWTGAPDVVAAANAVQAAELRAVGVSAVLARVCRDHPGWVADELATAWPQHAPDAFVAVLTALAGSWGPTEEELRRIQVPVGLVALAGDPMHPAGVATRWNDLIPRSRLATVGFEEPAEDRAVIGSAAWAACQEAAALSASR